MNRPLLLLAAACAAVPISSQFAPAQDSIRTIARAGEAAPGGGAGVVYSPIDLGFGFPYIHNGGAVAFSAGLEGTGVTSLNDRAHYAGMPGGPLTLVARENGAAAGTGPGVTYESFNDIPNINSAGAVAFRATLSGPGVTPANDLALYTGAPGALALTARRGGAAPGTASTFASFNAPAYNGAGQVAFIGNLDLGGAGNDVGIWRGAAGAVGLAVLEGDAAPGIGPGVFFNTFAGEPLINGTGAIAFRATVGGPGIGGANDLGVFAGAPGALALAAREGSIAPGTGAFFGAFEEVAYNDGGRLAFRGFLTGAGVTASNDFGVWVDAPGGLALAAREGSAAPGTTAGVVFGNLSTPSLGRPSLNGDGEIAFRGGLAGPGVTTANDIGIWAGAPAALALIAREGAQAPGAALGATFSSFNTFSPALGEDGEVAFLGNVTGPATAGRDSGIWMTDALGRVRLVAREGDVVEVAPSTFRVITDLARPITGAGGQDGRGVSINDDGEVVFTAGLTGGPAILVGTLPPEWIVDSSGNWSTAANWVGGVPDLLGGPNVANFRGAITTARTVTVDGAFTIEQINFNDDNAYTIAGDGNPAHALTLLDLTDDAAITVSQGSHTIAAPVEVFSDTNVVINNGSALELSGNVNIVSATALRKAGLGPGATGTLNLTGTVNLGAGATIDVGAGTMIIDATGAGAVGTGVTVNVAAGATLKAGGSADPFSAGANRAAVTNAGNFSITSGTKHVASISGAGGTTVGVFGGLNAGPVSQGGFQVLGTADVGNVNASITGVGNGTMAASLSANYVRGGALNIATLGIASIKPNGTDAGTSRVATLSIAGATDAWAGKLDLADNDLVIDYDAIAGSPITTVANQIKSGYAGGSWSGSGLTTSSGDASSFALGFAEASDLFTTFPATFSGQSVDDTSVLIRFTRYGDANLDGMVNLTDFNKLAANFGSSGATWSLGDFDYDGLVNLGDFNKLAANFGLSAAGATVTPDDWAALASAVPEPGIWGGAAAAMVTLLPRAARPRSRRRRELIARKS